MHPHPPLPLNPNQQSNLVGKLEQWLLKQGTMHGITGLQIDDAFIHRDELNLRYSYEDDFDKLHRGRVVVTGRFHERIVEDVKFDGEDY
jgi:exopolysaccharide biosynthesis predicted pyruvyltransferase EpsI